MPTNKYDETIKEDVIMENGIIARCVLTGSVTLINCSIRDTICQGSVVFTNQRVTGQEKKDEPR